MLEPRPDTDVKGLEVSPTICLSREIGLSVVITNPSGFTHKLEKGQDIGQAEAVQLIEQASDGTPTEDSGGNDIPVRRIKSTEKQTHSIGEPEVVDRATLM